MIPTGIFKVGVYECYAGSVPKDGKVNVILVDTFPILQAERAASSIARMLGSSDITLGKIESAKGTLYACKVSGVSVKELEKWQA